MGKLTLTLRVTNELPKHPFRGETEVETLCHIEDQHLSKGMLAAALRQLADEVDPPKAAF